MTDTAPSTDLPTLRLWRALAGCADCRGWVYSEPADYDGPRTVLVVHDDTCVQGAAYMPDRRPCSRVVDTTLLLDAFIGELPAAWVGSAPPPGAAGSWAPGKAGSLADRFSTFAPRADGGDER